MKITREEIKGLNVRTYIDWLVQIAEKVQEAAIDIPYIQKEIYSICLNKFKWALFYEAVKPDSHNVGWYHKYEELSEKKLIELIQKRDDLENDLVQAVNLAETEKVLKIINEEKSNKEDSVNKKVDRISEKNPDVIKSKSLSFSDFHELEEFQKKFMEAGIKPKESINLKIAKSINFAELNANIYYFKKIFEIHFECDSEKFERMQKINNNAVLTVLQEAEQTDFKYIDFIMNASLCREFFYNMDVSVEFERIAYYSYVANLGISAVTPKPVKTLNKIQFVELIKALIETKTLCYATEKEAVERLAIALGVDIDKSEFDRKLQKIRNRNAGEETLFINELKEALNKWICK